MIAYVLLASQFYSSVVVSSAGSCEISGSDSGVGSGSEVKISFRLGLSDSFQETPLVDYTNYFTLPRRRRNS